MLYVMVLRVEPKGSNMGKEHNWSLLLWLCRWFNRGKMQKKQVATENQVEPEYTLNDLVDECFKLVPSENVLGTVRPTSSSGVTVYEAPDGKTEIFCLRCYSYILNTYTLVFYGGYVSDGKYKSFDIKKSNNRKAYKKAVTLFKLLQGRAEEWQKHMDAENKRLEQQSITATVSAMKVYV